MNCQNGTIQNVTYSIRWHQSSVRCNRRRRRTTWFSRGVCVCVWYSVCRYETSSLFCPLRLWYGWLNWRRGVISPTPPNPPLTLHHHWRKNAFIFFLCIKIYFFCSRRRSSKWRCVTALSYWNSARVWFSSKGSRAPRHIAQSDGDDEKRTSSPIPLPLLHPSVEKSFDIFFRTEILNLYISTKIQLSLTSPRIFCLQTYQ